MTVTELHPAEDAAAYRDVFETEVTEGEVMEGEVTEGEVMEGEVTEGETTIRALPDGSNPTLVTADGDCVPIEINSKIVSPPEGGVIFISSELSRLRRTDGRLDSCYVRVVLGDRGLLPRQRTV